MSTICVYHANCSDGFGAAWAVHHRFKLDGNSVDFHPAGYGEAPPDVTGRDVLIVDFSFKRPVLDEMLGSARSLLILDHHKSAAEDLKHLFAPPSWGAWQTIAGDEHSSLRIAALFDMNRSGAGLAWDYFFPDKPRPQLIDHIEDRDLWRFKLGGTREIQAALASHPQEFGLWDKLMLETDAESLRLEGEAINRKTLKDIGDMLGFGRRRMTIGGHDVPVANVPFMWASDAGHILGVGEPFAATYCDTPEGRIFSLRSAPEGLDVSAIAKAYGGGGHAHAAGFRLPYDRLDGMGNILLRGDA